MTKSPLALLVLTIIGSLIGCKGVEIRDVKVLIHGKPVAGASVVILSRASGRLLEGKDPVLTNNAGVAKFRGPVSIDKYSYAVIRTNVHQDAIFIDANNFYFSEAGILQVDIEKNKSMR